MIFLKKITISVLKIYLGWLLFSPVTVELNQRFPAFISMGNLYRFKETVVLLCI